MVDRRAFFSYEGAVELVDELVGCARRLAIDLRQPVGPLMACLRLPFFLASSSSRY